MVPVPGSSHNCCRYRYSLGSDTRYRVLYQVLVGVPVTGTRKTDTRYRVLYQVLGVPVTGTRKANLVPVVLKYSEYRVPVPRTTWYSWHLVRRRSTRHLYLVLRLPGTPRYLVRGKPYSEYHRGRYLVLRASGTWYSGVRRKGRNRYSEYCVMVPRTPGN